MTADDAFARLHALANPEAAKGMKRFFKINPEEQGDRFLGVKAAPLHALARDCVALPLADVETLLHSPFHEARMLALLILARAFPKSNPATQKEFYEFYLDNTAHVNNWDLVDASAAPLVGGYLATRSRKPLDRLAKSKSLWERRIAIVATHHFIRLGDFGDTLRLAERLLGDPEDLMHKAIGWMLREVGKRDEATLEGFLRVHHAKMPRTSLRYAIERLPEERRRAWLRGESN